jgi:protease YdgD
MRVRGMNFFSLVTRIATALCLCWWILLCDMSDAAEPDGRSVADVLAYPWSAIGKLNNSVGGSCTGVVIEPDQVLTAAHCIFNPRRDRFLHPESLHFLLGYERGKYAIHARVTGYTIGPGYDPKNAFRTITSDWAVLRLTEGLPEKIKPLRIATYVPSIGAHLMTASYAAKTVHVMTADNDCILIGKTQSALLRHNCRVAEGSSGAPLLSIEKGDAVIVGIQVAIERGDAKLRLAVPATLVTKPFER